MALIALTNSSPQEPQTK